MRQLLTVLQKMGALGSSVLPENPSDKESCGQNKKAAKLAQMPGE